MDPKQCLSDASVALVEDDFEQCRDLLIDYRSWRAKGGFEPLLHNGDQIGPKHGDEKAAEIASYLPTDVLFWLP